jgi:3-hydroxybutyryl-CoA dehydrogenase
MSVESVAVVGGGLMGSGIAESVAIAGLPVVLREVDEPALERARERIEGSIARGVRGGKLAAEDAEAARGRIELTTALEAIAPADLVIEAVPEDERLKLEVMAAIDAIVSERAIVASNTSSIPIAELARALARPERVLGLHFFSPVPVMRLVEVVVALDTAPEVVPYLMAAVRMFEEGFASREDIDAGMKLGCGHPMGPLTLCDFIGLDVLYAVCDSLYEEFKRDEYAPPPLMKRMVASGRLGRKSGRGFYEYGEPPGGQRG